MAEFKEIVNNTRLFCKQYASCLQCPLNGDICGIDVESWTDEAIGRWEKTVSRPPTWKEFIEQNGNGTLSDEIPVSLWMKMNFG